MGLFDKLRGSDDGEEVELKPPRDPSFERTRRRVSQKRGRSREPVPSDGEEVELEDMWDQNRRQRRRRSQREGAARPRRDGHESANSDDDEFILPGMKSVSTQEDDTADEEAGFDGPTEEKLDRLLDQNDRIIALLEDIADQYGQQDDDSTPLGNTDMW